MILEVLAACTLAGCFVLYVIYLVRIVFGRALRSSLGETPEVQLQHFLSTTAPDCELALLWQTQAPVLESLKNMGSVGLRNRELCMLYCCFARSYPELCEGSTFDNWVLTLENAQVIKRNAGRVQITEKGLFMLDFVRQQNRCPCDDLGLISRR